MSIPLRLLLACTAFVSAAQAAPPGRVCAQQAGADERRAAVEQGVMPSVVFEGETQAQSLPERMATQRVPGLAVAVLRGGVLDWSAVYGRRAADRPAVGCTTRFQAGSLAKPVTLLAALRLADAGRLDWDRDVATQLRSVQLPPGRQSAEHTVTLRQLFAHTAGITPGGYPGYAQGGPVPSLADIVAGTGGSNTPRAEVLDVPGANLRYSGGGYSLAQIALQDTQGLAFEPLMRRWLFEPIRLRTASFALQAAGADVAEGHAEDGTRVPGGWLHLPESAAAGLWSDAGDLGTLLAEVWRGYHGRSAVFRQASLRALFDAPPVHGHAYGFRLVGEGRAQVLVHYGGTRGYNAGLVLNLQTGDGAVYLANGEGGRGLGHELLVAVSRTYGWGQFHDTRVRRAHLTADEVQGLAGRYAFGASGPRVLVEQAQAALTLVFPNGDRYGLTPIDAPEPLQFIHAGSGVRAGFQRGADGAVTLQLYGQQGLREADARP
ncbi:serine hydrolase domain-containing protein [Roseateles sp. LKC17W]|uniref:Serine hydrolase domain-containing protein n=1 Tax=Pelomonas margarita TaxID=3299031 RepID=A0ABW7FFX3_9BURK